MENLRAKIANLLESANYPAVNVRGGRRPGRPRVRKAVRKPVTGGRYALTAEDLMGGRHPRRRVARSRAVPRRMAPMGAGRVGGRRRVGRPRKMGEGFWDDVKQGFDSGFEKIKGVTKFIPGLNTVIETGQKLTGGPRLGLFGTGVVGGRRRPAKRATKRIASKSAPVKSNYKTERGYKIAKLMHQGYSLAEASRHLSGGGAVRG